MNIHKLMKDVHKLKHLPRTGWVNNRIPDPETVASHVLGVTFLAASLNHPKNLDKNRIIKLAIYQDLAEAKIGDFVSENGDEVDVDLKNYKEQREKEYFEKQPKQIKKFGIEYLEQKTPEANYVKDLDRLDMAFQAFFYEEETGKDLSEFFENATLHITSENLKKILEEIKNKRNA